MAFSLFDAPWLPIYTAVMFMFHPWFGWMTVGSALVLVVLAYLNQRYTGKALVEANQQNVTANLQTTKNLRNAEVIESMGMLDTLMARWGKRQRRVLVLQSDASDKGGVISSISGTFRNWSQSIMLALGAYLVITHQINPGLMMAGSLLLGRALAPVDQIIGSWKGFVAARVQYNRLNETLEKLHNEPDRMALPDPEGHIQVENTVVTPPGGKNPVIRNISFVTPQARLSALSGQARQANRPW